MKRSSYRRIDDVRSYLCAGVAFAAGDITAAAAGIIQWTVSGRRSCRSVLAQSEVESVWEPPSVEPAKAPPGTPKPVAVF